MWEAAVIRGLQCDLGGGDEMGEDVDVRGPDPRDRIVRLRAALLSGRGAGASEHEVLEHTRNRSLLGAASPALERAQVARQSGDLRAGGPSDGQRADVGAKNPEARWLSGRALLAGAAAGLLARSVATRLLRRGRNLSDDLITADARRADRE